MKSNLKAVKCIFFAALFFVGVFSSVMPLKAAEGGEEGELSYVDGWLSSCDLGAVNEGMENLFPGLSIDAETLLQMIISGNAGEAFKMLAGGVKDALVGEVSGIKNILIYIAFGRDVRGFLGIFRFVFRRADCAGRFLFSLFVSDGVIDKGISFYGRNRRFCH